MGPELGTVKLIVIRVSLSPAYVPLKMVGVVAEFSVPPRIVN